jgi:hypothetical protein
MLLMRTGCTLSWPCWQANGSARPSSTNRDSPDHDRPTGLPNLGRSPTAISAGPVV